MVKKRILTVALLILATLASYKYGASASSISYNSLLDLFIKYMEESGRATVSRCKNPVCAEIISKKRKITEKPETESKTVEKALERFAVQSMKRRYLSEDRKYIEKLVDYINNHPNSKHSLTMEYILATLQLTSRAIDTCAFEMMHSLSSNHPDTWQGLLANVDKRIYLCEMAATTDFCATVLNELPEDMKRLEKLTEIRDSDLDTFVDNRIPGSAPLPKKYSRFLRMKNERYLSAAYFSKVECDVIYNHILYILREFPSDHENTEPIHGEMQIIESGMHSCKKD